MGEQLTLASDLGREIVQRESLEWQTVKEWISGTSRWSICYTGVFKRIADGKLFMAHWRSAATECQDEQPFEYGDAKFSEVEPFEETVISYRPIPEEAK